MHKELYDQQSRTLIFAMCFCSIEAQCLELLMWSINSSSTYQERCIETTQCINNCMTNSHEHWYSPCASVVLKHNVWNCLFGASTPALHIKRDALRPPFVCELLPSCANAPVCRDPVCHSLSVLSHRLKINIYCAQDSSCEFIRLYAVSPLDLGPGKHGS